MWGGAKADLSEELLQLEKHVGSTDAHVGLTQEGTGAAYEAEEAAFRGEGSAFAAKRAEVGGSVPIHSRGPDS